MPRMHHKKMNCKDCSHQAYKRLTIKDIRAHLQGRLQVNCQYGSIARYRKNQKRSTVQILEILILTVRIVVGVRFRYQKFRFQP